MSMLLRNLQEHQQVMSRLAELAEPVEQAGRLITCWCSCRLRNSMLMVIPPEGRAF